ncbi:MAG: preprotein translocase subunit SecE [Endozoicomonadaceae bacterium]|nr:preprotein translocase subunit SecE [Endozoicomonadaceae bacterium]
MHLVTSETKDKKDTIKWLLIVCLIALGVWGNIYYSQISILYRVLALVGLAIAALFIVQQTKIGSSFWELLKESKLELRRVVWPTRQETMQTTLVVLVVVFFMGLVLWGIDSLLVWIIRSLV